MFLKVETFKEYSKKRNYSTTYYFVDVLGWSSFPTIGHDTNGIIMFWEENV